MAVAKKAPNPIDKHAGSRVRMRRMMLGMSQEKLKRFPPDLNRGDSQRNTDNRVFVH